MAISSEAIEARAEAHSEVLDLKARGQVPWVRREGPSRRFGEVWGRRSG